MSGEKYAEEHKKVKDIIDRMCKEAGSTAVVISYIGKELDMDSRVVNGHLRVMEIDGVGEIIIQGDRPHIFKMRDKDYFYQTYRKCLKRLSKHLMGRKAFDSIVEHSYGVPITAMELAKLGNHSLRDTMKGLDNLLTYAGELVRITQVGNVDRYYIPRIYCELHKAGGR